MASTYNPSHSSFNGLVPQVGATTGYQDLLWNLDALPDPENHDEIVMDWYNPVGYFPVDKAGSQPWIPVADHHQQSLLNSDVTVHKSQLVAIDQVSTTLSQEDDKGGVKKNFVYKLWDMLSDTSIAKWIYWNDDGLSFTISDQEGFVVHVMKARKYGKTEVFQSFIRQLNMYGFAKIKPGAQRGVNGTAAAKKAKSSQSVFSHPKFRKDQPDLLSEIKRKGTDQDAPPCYNTLPFSSGLGLTASPPSQMLDPKDPKTYLILWNEISRLRNTVVEKEQEIQALKASRQVQPLPTAFETSMYTSNGSTRQLFQTESRPVFQYPMGSYSQANGDGPVASSSTPSSNTSVPQHQSPPHNLHLLINTNSIHDSSYSHQPVNESPQNYGRPFFEGPSFRRLAHPVVPVNKRPAQ